MKRHHGRLFCFTLVVFLADLLDCPFRCFVWITKFTFPSLTLIIAQVLKEKWLKIIGFAHSQTTNKLVKKAANDSARVRGQDRKNRPLSEPIRLQDLEDSARSQAQKKIKLYIPCLCSYKKDFLKCVYIRVIHFFLQVKKLKKKICVQF